MDIKIESYSLILSITKNDIEMVKQLIKKGVDVNEPVPDEGIIEGQIFKVPPLHIITTTPKLNIEISSLQGVSLNYIKNGQKIFGCTPLNAAARNNDLECTKLLIEFGANVIPKTEEFHHPIHYAVFNNSVDVARELLQYGANANVRFNNKFFEENPVTMDRSLWQDHDLPLLHYAILKKFDQMSDLLRDYVDINLKTNLGKTALMQAVEVNNKKWVKALVNKKNVNDRDNFGQPVLHFTMVNANRKRSMHSKEEFDMNEERLFVIKVLVYLGADVNARFPENDKYGCIIHYMIKYGYCEGIAFLLFQNNNLNINEIDMTTLRSAWISDEHLTPDILNIDNGAYVNNLYKRLQHSMYYIVEKLIELQMIGVPVDESLISTHPIYPWITEEKYASFLDWHRNRVMLEINYLKETKICDSNITLWNLLTCEMNKLIKLMSNEHIKNFEIKDQTGKINRYYFVLKKRLEYAKNRKLFLQKNTELIFSSTFNYLDFDCCETIVNFL